MSTRPAPHRPTGPSRRRTGRGRSHAVALVAVLLAVGGCGEPDPGPGGGGPRVATVEVMRVETAPLRDVATFSGQLDAEFAVVIQSEIDGVVESIEFEEGQRVAKDQVLIRLRSDTQRAALREAEASELLAEEEYERVKNLVTRDAASQAKKDEVSAQLEIARARAERARVELARTRLRAPFDGVVGFRNVAPGDFITEEDGLVTIAAIDRLQLSFAMSEHAVAFARTGMQIEAMVAPYPGERFPGTVFVISPTVDPKTRRVVLKAWVPNPDHRLRPGMFADVDLLVASRDEAIVVPEAAVVFDHHGPFVWRVTKEGDAVERVPIETGLRSGGVVEVVLGLQPGDEIVTAGTNKVSEGSKIAVVPRTSSGQARRNEPGGSGEEGT